MEKELTWWQSDIAYVFMLSPIVMSFFLSGAYPPPDFEVKRFWLTFWVAMCASIFVVWRKPKSIIGWIGVTVWGAITVLIGVANAINYTQDYLKTH